MTQRRKKIHFWKMQASGNDFIVMDNRARKLKITPGFVKRVCARHTGIGADGILLFENSKKAKFKMRIINSDGSEADACGNGFRCIALFANKVMKLPAQFFFESGAGRIHAQVGKKNIQVELTPPTGLQMDKTLEARNHRLHYSFVNTGVPHVVIFVQKIQQVQVQELGNAVRYHAYFKPKGTNVNFVEVKSKNRIRVRTYERGVEAETLACGTGSTASAILSVASGYVKPPVSVQTSSGEILKINFKQQGKKISKVTLEGSAYFVYEGEIYVS